MRTLRRAILATMFRLAAALLLALCLAPPARATLAAIAPARDGLVIAADSRLTFMGAHCDGAFKVLLPARPARTVAIVTGDSFFVAPPPPRTHDLCRYLATAPRLLDIGAVVTQTLERGSGSAAQISVNALAQACVDAVERFQASHPQALREYAGKEIFSVTVAGYDPASATSTLRNFVVRGLANTGTLQIRADRLTTVTITPASARGIWIYGESDWVNRNVYAGAGRRFLSSAALRFLSQRATVAATSRAEAVAAARNVIAAAGRTTALLPAPSGIGGTIRVVVLNRGPRPSVLP